MNRLITLYIDKAHADCANSAVQTHIYESQMSNVFTFPALGICRRNVFSDPGEENHSAASFLQVSVILEKCQADCN